MENLTSKILAKKKCTELAQMCRDKKLPVSGTKAILIARILGQAPPAPRPKAKKAPVARADPPVLEHVRRQLPSIILKKNEWGNFEDSETHFVFSKETKKVVGIQNGEVLERLNMTDVSACKERGFRVDDKCVDKEFSSEQSVDRLNELLKYMGEEDEAEEEALD